MEVFQLDHLQFKVRNIRRCDKSTKDLPWKFLSIKQYFGDLNKKNQTSNNVGMVLEHMVEFTINYLKVVKVHNQAVP